MKCKLALCVVVIFFPLSLSSQTLTPDIFSWYLNTSGITGYSGLPANVQQVRYSGGYVYVTCSNIPSYTIGPWPSNPNVASNQNFTFKITRNPQVNAGTKTATPLGHIGTLVNGVSIFNPKDAMSYNNQNVWHQNAVIVEAPSFDTCLGHPQMQGEYHHHQIPRCLLPIGTSTHSPLMGYAYDGFPMYGPYAYTNTDGTGSITRMKSSYRKRNITQRTTLADGTVLTPSQYGPAVSATYPLGYYIEDFEYVSGLADLDQYNGRYCKTPEYPQGVYAYFATIDSLGNAAYTYLIGPSYYGVVVAGNTGPGGGHVTISESVTSFPGVITYDASDTTDENVSKNITLHTQASGGLSITYAIIDSPNHGTLSGIPSLVNYLPDVNYFGTDEFRFSASVPGGGSDTAIENITIVQVGDTLAVVQFQVNDNWNLLSLPVSVDDSSTGALFSTAISEAFAYQGVDYIAVPTLSHGQGYWIRFDWQQTITMTGIPRTNDTINVIEGWNLIGSIGSPIDVTTITSDPGGIITSQFFGYQQSYLPTNIIEPGRGYWVKASSAGLFVLASTGSAEKDRIRIVAGSELPPNVPGEHRQAGIPSHFHLEQNFPNPFNPTTTLQFEVPPTEPGSFVTLKVFNVLGKEIATLVNEQKEHGKYAVSWDAGEMPGGIYFYRMTAGGYSKVKPMVLLK